MTTKKHDDAPAPAPHPISIWDFPDELQPQPVEFVRSEPVEPETVPVKSADKKES